MNPAEILDLFDDLVSEVVDVLSGLDDWGPSGEKPGQYVHDVVADKVVVGGLHEAGLRVLSEETGLTGTGDVTVVVDPVDGSTNASRGLPWYATSLCAVDVDGPWVADVVNLATGDRWRAVRGSGVEATHAPLAVTGRPQHLSEAIIACNGLPPGHGGWRQFRCYGAAALDLCSITTGVFDGYVDVSRAHGVWDYLGAMLVCQEAGVPIVDAYGRDLVVLDPAERRGPVAAATPELLAEVMAMQAPW
ncbi:MAG: inositol monophosphatase family protein [Acidimicrobiales bacterium]